MKTGEYIDRNRSTCGILIPVYNSTQHLRELLNRINEVRKQESGWRFPVIIIDDGSQPPVQEFALEGLEVQRIRHEENQGKGAALRSGFKYFLNNREIRAVLALDADLQHLPEHIPAFLRKFEEGGGDVIVGSRQRNPKVMPLHRIVSNSLTSKIISAMIGQKVEDSQCGFRLYSRRALENVMPGENRFHLESEFLIRSGWKKFRIASVPIRTIYNDVPSAIRNIPDTLNFISLILKLSFERIRGHV